MCGDVGSAEINNYKWCSVSSARHNAGDGGSRWPAGLSWDWRHCAVQTPGVVTITAMVSHRWQHQHPAQPGNGPSARQSGPLPTGRHLTHLRCWRGGNIFCEVVIPQSPGLLMMFYQPASEPNTLASSPKTNYIFYKFSWCTTILGGARRKCFIFPKILLNIFPEPQ